MLKLHKKITYNILSVLSISWDVKKDYARPRKFNALSLRINGEANFVHGDDTYNVKKGDIIFVPANLDYTINSYKREDVIVIHFDILNHKFNQIETFCPANSSIFVDLFSKLYSAWYNKPVGYEYKLYSIFYSILENIEIQSKDVAMSSSTNLQNILNYLHSNFSDSSLSIDDLAKFCNVSTTYFRRLFINNLGTTPLRYLTDLRMKHAASLLKSGYYTVEMTAQRSGYDNVKYFSTAFKKYFGISPSKYKT